MNTCDACKWWEPPKEGNDHHNMGICESENLVYNGHSRNDSLCAGEVWSFPLAPSTGPKFGCVHWEPKS